jgi:hypothetical protein
MNPAFKALPAAFANRKCRFRRRLPYVLFSSLFLLPFLGFTGYAQCPNGKPQHPVYGCGERPSTTPTPTPTRRPRSTPPAGGRCKIQIRINTQEENQPLDAMTVYINGSTNRLGKSNEQGEVDFDNLPCNRLYRVIPSNGEFEFTPPYYDQLSSKNPQNLLFLASPRKVGVLTSEPVEPPCVPPSATPIEITIGETRKDQISALCVAPGQPRFYKEYALRDMLGGDILHLTLGASPLPDLIVQAFDKAGQPIKVEAVTASGGGSYFKIDFPVAREFLLRVLNNANQPADYELKLTRESLTNEGYILQLQRLYETVTETGSLTLFDSLNANIERLRSADPVAEQKLTKAFGILEQLQKLRPDKPQVHAMLAAIYLYQKKDLKAATQAAIESLKLGGEARFRASFGKQIDKKERRIASGGRNGWLVLQKGEVYFEAFGDDGDRKIFTSPLQLLRKKNFDKTEIDYALSIYGRNLKEPKDPKKSRESDAKEYDFIPLSLRDGDPVFQRKEVAAIKGLLKEYILMEPPVEIRQ